MVPAGTRHWLSGAMLLLGAVTVFACAAEPEQVTHGTGAHSPVEQPHWEYAGPAGPEHWDALSPEYAACATGRRQSPVDIATPVEADLDPLEFEYGGRTTALLNNGHTIQMDAGPGSWLRAGADRWELVQLHVHDPAEHHLRGERLPLELHFVHRAADGRLAVVARLFRQGAADSGLEPLWTDPPGAGERRPLAMPLDGIAPASGAPYFLYDGSLTTPPCSEGVRWHVLRDVGTVSAAQVSALERAVGRNARPLQPLNGREVLQ